MKLDFCARLGQFSAGGVAGFAAAMLVASFIGAIPYFNWVMVLFLAATTVISGSGAALLPAKHSGLSVLVGAGTGLAITFVGILSAVSRI